MAKKPNARPSSKELEKLKALKNLEPIKRDTAIGFCAGFTVYTKFLESVVSCFQTMPRVGWLVSTISGPAIMAARRDLVNGFLKDTQAEYLMMVDSDMEFQPQDVLSLYDSFKDPSVGAVSGLYVDGLGYPVAGWFTASGGYKSILKPPVEPMKIDCVGAGFLLIRRKVLDSKNFKEHSFDHVTLGTEVLGEDVSFCRRLKDNNWKLILHPAPWLGHLKVRRVYPDGQAIP